MSTRKSPTSPAITRRMPVADIVAFLPEAKETLAEYGLHCFHCVGSTSEILEDGCRLHGFEDEQIDALVEDLNDMLERTPGRPKTLVITAPAARAIRQVAVDEKRGDEGLAVIVDERGGFCMEFRPEPESDETTFCNDDVPSVRIFASTLTLKRIGGSTIDFREGRFKLDLPTEDAANQGCGCGGSCTCAH